VKIFRTWTSDEPSPWGALPRRSWDGRQSQAPVVISREDPDSPRALAICAPLTTENRGSDYEVSLGKLKFLDRGSWVNVQGVMSLGHEKLIRRLGRLTTSQMEQLKAALRFALDL
jgi:mRNA interferase MazF